MTAPTDAGVHWYRWQARWRASRWHPVRLLDRPWRRWAALGGLLVLDDVLDWVADTASPSGRWWWTPLLALLVFWWWLGAVGDTWSRQVQRARNEPRPPPALVHAAIMGARYEPGEVPLDALAGWDQIEARVHELGRSVGLDLDDPATVTTMAAAITLCRAHCATWPVVPDDAMRLHENVWRVRVRELDRRGPSKVTP